MKTKIKDLLIAGPLLGLVSLLNAQTHITHDFNDGGFGSYEVNKSDQQARVYIANDAVETRWVEDLYNGTNSGRKAQFRPINDIFFTQHIWMGLRIKIHSDYMKDNTNTNAGLMQIWGYNGASGAANHMCMLKFDGRNGGALVWQHRYNSVANKTHYLVQPNFPRNEFVDVVVHVKLAEYNKGLVQVWVDGDLKLNEANQTIGWGQMDSSGMINGTYCFGTSLGQYNYFENAGYDDAYDGANHWFDGHLPGETRTVTYDNVALYNGTDGFDLVNPSPSGFTPDPNKTYYIDCPHHNLRLAATGSSEDAYTTSTSTTGADVEWKFVDKGNGYWHIDRAAGGAKPRLRTDNSANADMQETSSTGSYTYYDFSPGSSSGTHFLTLANGPSNYMRLQVNSSGQVKMVTSNHSGTWESFTITEVSGSGMVNIVKRNALSYALDGGNGGTNGQNVYLWNYSSSNVNQQWEEIDRGNGYYSYQKLGTNFSLDGGNGGANNQNVYLWTTNASNYNQHWQKVDMGNGFIQLRKRNSTGYGMNGGSGGANGQNVNLYDSSNSSHNLQWRVE